MITLKNMIFSKDEFHTRDITLSAYLIISWFELSRVEREGTKWAFFFKLHDRLDLACQIYYAGEAMVDPQQLMNRRWYLKTRIFWYLYPSDYAQNPRLTDPE